MSGDAQHGGGDGQHEISFGTLVLGVTALGSMALGWGIRAMLCPTHLPGAMP